MPSPPCKRRWAQWASVLVLGLAGVYFVGSLSRHIGGIPPIDWSFSAVLVFALTALLMLLNFVLGGVMWRWLLVEQGQTLTAGRAVSIIGMSQIGKYLPGNVGHFVGQVGLAKAAGVPLGLCMTTMLIFNLWLVAIGTALGAAGFWLFLDISTWVNWPQPEPLGVVVLSVLALASPWLGLWSINRWWPALALKLGNGHPPKLPTVKIAVALALGFALTFVIFGFMVQLQATHLFGMTSGDLLSFTLMFATAWVAGYVLPGAPGGLGVREAMVVAMLTPVVGAGAAIGLSITMRLATVAGDGLAFGLGWALKTK